MGKTIACALGLILLAVAYAAWPLLSAAELKGAIKKGDVATLERMVKWTPVRASLKASLAALQTVEATTESGHGEHGTGLRRRLWTRIKAAATPVVADHFIESYISPEGFVKLQHMRASGGKVLGMLGFPSLAGMASASGTAAGTADDDVAPLSRFQEFQRLYARLVDARFLSPTMVEFVIADSHDQTRNYASIFELDGFEWKLSSLRIVSTARR